MKIAKVDKYDGGRKWIEASPRRRRRVRRTRQPLPATVGQGEGKLQNAPRPRVDRAQVNPLGVGTA